MAIGQIKYKATCHIVEVFGWDSVQGLKGGREEEEMEVRKVCGLVISSDGLFGTGSLQKLSLKHSL